MEYHVAKNGSDSNTGTETAPWLTINHAAQQLVAGDTVTVHEGVYRERIDPRNGGRSAHRRIVYRAAAGEHVVVKGSEIVTGWQSVGGSVFQTKIANSLFGDFNPFATVIDGDWLISKGERVTHLGALYADGQAFYEAKTLAELKTGAARETVKDFMTQKTVPEPFPKATTYQWFAEVGDTTTTLFANFQDIDPTKVTTEVNVRPVIFYPSRIFRNYITVEGFEFAQAATPWAPPTGDQPGMIGTHWSKGWLIQNNVLHDAKTSAISLGKDGSTGDNYYTRRGDKPGYQYQLEAVFEARAHAGWDKEHVGSHQVLHNTIYNCGQCGVVGHLGAVFSTIKDNHIYHIGLMREFYGWEQAGIKLHAALDVQLVHNRIHDCVLGTWLDWEAQGVRVTRNLYYHNNRNLFVEVSHGPFLIDNNIFLGPLAVEEFSQGGALVHNLIQGATPHIKVLDRFTPYHAAHSTQVTGYAAIYGGDDRAFANLYTREASAPLAEQGTAMHEGQPTNMADYARLAQGTTGWPQDLTGFQQVMQPAYLNDNVYCGVNAASQETHNLINAEPLALTLTEPPDDHVTLRVTVPQAVADFRVPALTSADLPPVRLAGVDFEDPAGDVIAFTEDVLGERATTRPAGPFTQLHAGENTFQIW